MNKILFMVSKKECVKMLFSVFFAMFFGLLSIYTGYKFHDDVRYEEKKNIFNIVTDLVMFVIFVYFTILYIQEICMLI